VPPSRLVPYCRLLPPCEIAKSFSTNGMVGRGGGDRTHDLFACRRLYKPYNASARSARATSKWFTLKISR
jgi:hypothetical protein